MRLQVRTALLRLELRDPFTLSYGTSTSRTNVLVRVLANGAEGLGEAACPPYCGYSADDIIAEVGGPRVAARLSEAPGDLDSWLDALGDLSLAAQPARAALDIALHDLWGKLQRQPLHKMWGLDLSRCPCSSFTVAMDDDTENYRRRLRAARTFRLVKLKLGCGDPERDLALVALARQELRGASICIDANGAWTAAETLDMLPRLMKWAPSYLEQPVAKLDYAGWQDLRDEVPSLARALGPLPRLIADESVQGPDDLPRLAGLVDGVNVKLSKCGGLAKGRAMVASAQALGLQLMIGSMIESSIGVSAAALLGPSAHFVDLDANLLISNDPFAGVRLSEGGELQYTDNPGIGVTEPMRESP